MNDDLAAARAAIYAAASGVVAWGVLIWAASAAWGLLWAL